MWVKVETELECPAEAAWNEIQKPSLLEKISVPLVTFKPTGGPFPERWREGETVDVRLSLFGIVPAGVHSIHFEAIDDARMCILTREHDPIVKTWDHTITIESIAPRRCRYRDEIRIDAGRLTPVVWAWARMFYQHRQRGWRKLAPTL